jgi:hypothetical protein
MKRLSILFAITLTAMLAAGVYAKPPDATISFGIEGEVGAPNHQLDPDEVCIPIRGKVAFEVHGFHQVTVYKVALTTTRDNITEDIISGENYVLTDGDGNSIVDTARRDFEHSNTIHDHTTSPLLALGANPNDMNVVAVNRDKALSIEVVFQQAGRYLVHCGVKGHLDDAMLGFVQVGGCQ